MSTSLRQNAYLAASFAACLLFLFWPGLLRSEVPAFRDTFHFYYPQAVWLCERAAEGDYFPSWSCNEGLGSSVSGQASSALYYPLRIVWATPALSVAQRLSLYIVIHLLLAATGIGFAAKQFQLNRAGVWLTAISYSLSCPVLFQHSNLIYLHSAAWIGFAIAATLQLLERRATWLRSCLLFAAAIAMMVLGGDFHTAVNAALVTGVMLALHLVRFSQEPISALTRSAAWLLTAAFLTIAITAIQWIPTYRWSRLSDRVAQGTLESFHQSSSAVADLTPINRWPKTKHQIYDFSLSPWHAATLVWPTLGGHYQPENGRLFSVIPAEGRMWLPSLYVGLIPCLLLIRRATNFILRSPRPKQPTHSRAGTGKGSKTFSADHPTKRSTGQPSQLLLAVLGLSFLASLGNYSPVWFAREICKAFSLDTAQSSLPSDPVSSVYHLLTLAIPGYDSFRYPAKWTVWIAASVSLLAGLALQTGEAHHQLPVANILGTKLRWLLLGTSTVIAAAAALLIMWSSYWSMPSMNDAWLGPLNYSTAGWMMLASVAPLVLLCLFASVVTRPRASFWVGFTLIEMTFAASFWIHFCPAPDLLGAIDIPAESVSAARVFVWADTSEANLLRDTGGGGTLHQTEYQGQWWLGKLSTLADARNLNASMTMEPELVGGLQNWLSDEDSLQLEQPSLDSVLRELGVTHRLVRESSSMPTQYAWLGIASPRPLCELRTELHQQERSDSVELPSQWTWSSQLSVELPSNASTPKQLIVRQFNDGGWIAYAHFASGAQSLLEIDLRPSLFLTVPIPPNALSVTLRRKLLY